MTLHRMIQGSSVTREFYAELSQDRLAARVVSRMKTLDALRDWLDAHEGTLEPGDSEAIVRLWYEVWGN